MRDAAKVTTPSLLEAFEEGHGMSKEQIEPADTPPRIYLVLATNGELVRQVFDLDQLGIVVTSIIAEHLAKGEGHAAAVSVQVLPPEDWDDISDAAQ